MFLTKSVYEDIRLIYNNLDADGSSKAVVLANLLKRLNLFTYRQPERVTKDQVYFLNNVLHKVETGNWMMHPAVWANLVVNNPIVWLTDTEISESFRSLSVRRAEVLAGKRLSEYGSGLHGDRGLKLILARCKDGEETILSITKAMLATCKYFNQ